MKENRMGEHVNRLLTRVIAKYGINNMVSKVTEINASNSDNNLTCENNPLCLQLECAGREPDIIRRKERTPRSQVQRPTSPCTPLQ